jgi:hypothetical protein
MTEVFTQVYLEILKYLEEGSIAKTIPLSVPDNADVYIGKENCLINLDDDLKIKPKHAKIYKSFTKLFIEED